MTPSMASSTASAMTIRALPPRFLLPALSSAWRATTTRVAVPRSPRIEIAPASPFSRRQASTSTSKDGKKPIVLEKPAKFNPPSHGARLPRRQGPKQHYGGGLSEGEKTAQRRREYPGMMAPEGTVAHRFIHSRRVHLVITLGTLTILAISTFVLNFAHTSPFKHLLPPAGEFWSGPVEFIRTWTRVVQLHERDRNEKVIAQHTRHTDDVAKRAYFRKVHGLDKENPIKNWLGVTEEGDEVEGAVAQAPSHEVNVADETAAAAAVGVGKVAAQATGEAQEQERKKWFGVI